MSSRVTPHPAPGCAEWSGYPPFGGGRAPGEPPMRGARGGRRETLGLPRDNRCIHDKGPSRMSAADFEHRPLSHPQVAAIELVAEVLARGELDPNADQFYGRLCEVVCEVTSLTRAVIFRYDAARRRVRAAGSYGIDLSVF